MNARFAHLSVGGLVELTSLDKNIGFVAGRLHSLPPNFEGDDLALHVGGVALSGGGLAALIFQLLDGCTPAAPRTGSADSRDSRDGIQ